jgi:hypothetical protein
MSVGEEKSNGLHESHKAIVKDAIEQAAEPQEHAADVLPAGVESAPCHGPGLELRELPPPSGCARAAEAQGGELGDLINLRGSTPKRPASGSGCQSSCAGVQGRAQPVPSMHAEFRTEVAVAGVTVTGVLPATARAPVGAIAISGDVRRLSCDHALELVDALLLVVTRMDLTLEERYSATTTATHDGRTEVNSHDG